MTTESPHKPYVQVAQHQVGAATPSLRVPWVAQWSDEVGDDPVQPFQIGPDVAIRYTDETPDDRVLGVLWMRTRVDRGGYPQFAQLNVYRQREAMIHQLCQVCGLPAGDSWLIAPVEHVRSGPIQTAMPPTCEACVSVARRQCPMLDKNRQRSVRSPHPAGEGTLLKVRNYRLFAVYGDVVEFVGGKIVHRKGEFRLSDPRSKTNILGRQLVAEIYDYRRKR